MGCGPAEQRLLLTGLHSVADIFCQSCKTTLGWKYVSAPRLGPPPAAGTARGPQSLPGHPNPRLGTPGHPNPCHGHPRAPQTFAADTPKPGEGSVHRGTGGLTPCPPQEQAFESSQKYKEGKFIIEMSHMVKENGWD